MPQYSDLNQAQCEAGTNSIVELMSEVTLDEIRYYEEVAKGQSLSIAWHEHQSGWITGYIVYEVAKASLKNPAKSLVLQITKPNFKMLNTQLFYGIEKKKKLLEMNTVTLCQIILATVNVYQILLFMKILK